MFTSLIRVTRLGLFGWWVVVATAAAGASTNTAWFSRAWQTDEGLPDNAVVGVAQTPDGFLWVATQGGLARFDGNQFRDFAPVTEIGVPSGLLYSMCVDRRGRLWVAKEGGVVVCVDEGRTAAVTLEKGSANARAVTLVEDREGALWASYAAGGGRAVRIREGEVRYFSEADGVPPGRTLQFASDRDGQVWFAMGDKVGCVSRRKVPRPDDSAGCAVHRGGKGGWNLDLRRRQGDAVRRGQQRGGGR